MNAKVIELLGPFAFKLLKKLWSKKLVDWSLASLGLMVAFSLSKDVSKLTDATQKLALDINSLNAQMIVVVERVAIQKEELKRHGNKLDQHEEKINEIKKRTVKSN